MEDAKLSVFEKISLWWRFDGKYIHKNIYQGILNLIKWFKIVWKDRDYDDHFIFEVLKFKIEKTAKFTERRKWFVGWEHEVSRMKMCVKLIQRIQDEYYGMEYYDYQESTFEFIEVDDKDENGEKSFQLKSDIVKDNLDEYIKKYPNTYKKVIKEFPDRSKRSICLFMGNEMHKKAKRILFKTLDKHIEHWWD